MPKLPDIPPDDAPQHVKMLIAIRQRNNWSQAQLGQQLGVSDRTILRWETEQQEPPSFLMPALRELLTDNLSPSGAYSF